MNNFICANCFDAMNNNRDFLEGFIGEKEAAAICSNFFHWANGRRFNYEYYDKRDAVCDCCGEEAERLFEITEV